MRRINASTESMMSVMPVFEGGSKTRIMTQYVAARLFDDMLLIADCNVHGAKVARSAP